jgi:hypothetical protein
MQQTKAAPQKQLKQRKTTPEQLDKTLIENTKAQDRLLAVTLLHPPLRKYLEHLHADMFILEPAQKLYTFLQANPDFDGKSTEVAGLKELADYVKIVVLQYEELYQGLELLELQYEAARLRTRLVEQYVKHEKQKLAAAMEGADESKTHTLLERVKQLDELRNLIKGGANG